MTSVIVLAFFCLVIGLMIVVPVALFGAIAFFAIRHSRENAKRWQESAGAMGLVLDGSGGLGRLPTMSGERGGLRVEVGRRSVERQRSRIGSGSSRHHREHFTYAKVFFPRSIELGLDLGPKGLLALLGNRSPIGLPAIDDRYEVRTADPDATRALLSHPAVTEGFAAIRGMGARLNIDDASVRYEVRGALVSTSELTPMLDTALEMAGRVWAARFETSGSTAERVVREVWSGVANELGFTTDIERTRIEGRRAGLGVEVDTVLRGNARHTVFTVRFDAPLGLSLQLHRQNALHSVSRLLGAQDIRVGDPVFDARFVVKGRPEDQVRALLTEEVRAALVTLQDHASELRVEDDHLEAEVSWLVCDPGALRSGIDTVIRVASTMVEVEAGGAGPYRR